MTLADEIWSDEKVSFHDGLLVRPEYVITDGGIGQSALPLLAERPFLSNTNVPTSRQLAYGLCNLHEQKPRVIYVFSTIQAYRSIYSTPWLHKQNARLAVLMASTHCALRTETNPSTSKKITCGLKSNT